MQIVSLGENLYEMSTLLICIKCQILFSGKSKKNNIKNKCAKC